MLFQRIGKFYHRHRRPNDQVEYNTDPEFHLAKRKGTEEARRLRKRGGASRLAAESASAADTPASAAPAETLLSDDDDDDDDDVPLATRATRHSQPPVNHIRILSDLSDPDSGNEENGNLIVKDTKRRPLTSASNSSLSPPPPIPATLPEADENPSMSSPHLEKPSLGSKSPSSPSIEPHPAPVTAPGAAPVSNGVRPPLTRKSTAPHVLVVR